MDRAAQKRVRVDGVVWLAGLSVAACAGNYLTLPLFAGVDLFFGGVAVMLAVLRLSLPATLTVALAGSLPLVLFWGYTFDAVILIAEAFVVHLGWNRGRYDLVICDLAFWLALGMPAVGINHGYVADVDAVGGGLAALKGAVNGVSSAAAAALIYRWALQRVSGRERAARIGMADYLAPAFVLFAVIPTLLALALQSRAEDRMHLRDIEDDLVGVYRDTVHLEKQHQFSGLNARMLHEELAATGPDGLAIALLDRDGRIIQQYPGSWLSDNPVSRKVSESVTQRLPGEASSNAMRAARDSYYLRQFEFTGGHDSRVRYMAIGTPAAIWIDQLRGNQLLALCLTLLIVVAAVLTSQLIGRRLGRELQGVADRLQRVPDNVRTGGATDWPEFKTGELTDLITGARSMEDVLRRQNAAMLESQQRFEATAANLPGGVSRRVMTPDGDIHFPYLSSGFQEIFGIDRERAQKDPRVMKEVILPEDRPNYRAALEESARTLSRADIEFRIRLPSGRIRWVRALGQPRKSEDGSVIWDGIALDDTERKHADEELRRLAYEDQLTGLPSRHGFLVKLRDWLENRDRGEPAGSLVLFDIIGLNDVNQTYGYQAGDLLLQAIARRLRDVLRDGEMAGRLSGDQFCLLFEVGKRWLEDPAELAAWMDDLMMPPFQVEEEEIHIEMRLGIATIDTGCDSAEEAIRQAMLAMHTARREGRSRWVAFSDALDAAARERIGLTRALRKAIDNDEFELHFQPRVSLEDRRILSAEALIRWRDPASGELRPPDEFIPLAESAQLIFAIGEWVIRDALTNLRSWQQAGWARSAVSVNVSVSQFLYTDLPAVIRRITRELDVTPEGLIIEVTESIFAAEPERVRAQLEKLRDLGVRISLDDFGKGYSSLSYLQIYRVDEIKIDQSFVRNCAEHAYSREIVLTVNRIASVLGCGVVAEGIETREDMETVRALGCEMGQGYYFARPMGAEAFRRLALSGEI